MNHDQFRQLDRLMREYYILNYQDGQHDWAHSRVRADRTPLHAEDGQRFRRATAIGQAIVRLINDSGMDEAWTKSAGSVVHHLQASAHYRGNQDARNGVSEQEGLRNALRTYRATTSFEALNQIDDYNWGGEKSHAQWLREARNNVAVRPTPAPQPSRPSAERDEDDHPAPRRAPNPPRQTRVERDDDDARPASRRNPSPPRQTRADREDDDRPASRGRGNEQPPAERQERRAGPVQQPNATRENDNPRAPSAASTEQKVDLSRYPASWATPEQLTQAQTQLQAIGYLNSEQTGIGDPLHQALIRFQIENRLTVDARITPQLLERLGQVAAARTQAATDEARAQSEASTSNDIVITPPEQRERFAEAMHRARAQAIEALGTGSATNVSGGVQAAEVPAGPETATPAGGQPVRGTQRE